MKVKVLVFPLVLVAVLGAIVFAQGDRKPGQKRKIVEKGVRFDPVVRNMEGWTVHIDPALIEGEHAGTGAKCLRMLGDHLNRIALLVQGDVLKRLQKCEIWIEHKHPSLGAMQYHPGEGWLRRYGHDPRLNKKVHIPQAEALISRGQLLKHPAVVLHELAHAYHDQVLGFDYKPIVDSYEDAMKEGSYEKVLLYTGRTVRHYGATNHKEYFAEGTEAYFYHNDFYPFVRAELRKHDPTLHDALKEVWGPVQ